MEAACPLTDLRLEGDPDGVFDLVPAQPGAADALREAMDAYPETLRGRLTVHRPEAADSALWMHPGEPVFERFCAALLARQAREALRGAIFIDPHAEAPYLLHLAQTSLLRRSGNAWEVVESRPVGLRQEGGGSIATCPLEHLLLLRGAHGIPPGSVPLCPAGAPAGGKRGSVAERKPAPRHGAGGPPGHPARAAGAASLGGRAAMITG